MKSFHRFIKFLYGSFRPFLGSLYVCIYQESCSVYAARLFTTISWPRALFFTLLRLLSCNPITGLVLAARWYLKMRWKKYLS